jgi:exosome complex component RRP46
MIRPDGRSNASMLRPLSAELSPLHRADGSAKFSCGQTSVLAAVYGPASGTRELSSQNAQISVVVKQGTKGGSSSSSSIGLACCDARELEHIIQRSISTCVLTSLYPRSIIEIVLQVLKEDGSVVSAAFNAAVIALMDANIGFICVPIATTCLVNHNNAVINLDPTAEEETNPINDDNATLVVLITAAAPPKHAVDNKGGEKQDVVIASLTVPRLSVRKASQTDTNTKDNNRFMSQQAYMSSIQASFRASKAIIEFIRMAMEVKVSKESKTVFQRSTGSQQVY